MNEHTHKDAPEFVFEVELVVAAQRQAHALERIARTHEAAIGFVVVIVLVLAVIAGCLWTIAIHV